MTPWTHVLVMGLPDPHPQPKRWCFDIRRTVFGANSAVYYIDRPTIDKLTKPVPTEQALLVGLPKRPHRDVITAWEQRLHGCRSHVMLGHKVWTLATSKFRVNEVAPNHQRIYIGDRTQAMYDIACAEDFRKRIPRHHPMAIEEHYKHLGFSVESVSARHGLDGRPISYDAVVQLGDIMPHTGLVALGRHSAFSGLLVPCES